MDEAEIIAGLKNRDTEAARELIRNFGDRLLRSAYLLCDNKEDAQDLAQKTLVEAVRSIHRFQGKSALHTWLYGILLNVTRSHYRSQRRMQFTYHFPTAALTILPADMGASLDKDSSRLAVLVQRLPPSYREVIILRFHDGMKLEEIAQKTLLPLNTVKTRLSRALKWLRRSLPKSETF